MRKVMWFLKAAAAIAAGTMLTTDSGFSLPRGERRQMEQVFLAAKLSLIFQPKGIRDPQCVNKGQANDLKAR